MIVIEVFASGCEPAPERRSVDKAADLAAASCAGQACYGVVVAGLCCIWRMWWAEALALSLLMLARCRIWTFPGRRSLVGRTYVPLPARKQEIPKDGGKVRVLSIPAIRDRVVQGALKLGGVLHSARFRRKPRGGPAGHGEEHDRRFSFCCALDLCRRRATPPSFRFLGRKVYRGAVVVLISAMRQGATAARQLSELFGVSRRTIARWREWWRGAFAASPFWRVGRSAFMPPVDEARLPASLLERFAGEAAAQLIIPPQDRPPVIIPFFTFRIMVGCVLMLLLSWVGAYLGVKGRIELPTT